MRFTHRCISSLLLAAALGAPVAVMAAPGQKDVGVQVRSMTPATRTTTTGMIARTTRGDST